MKRFLSLLLVILLCAALFAVNFGAVPADEEDLIDPYEYDVVFINNTHYSNVTIHYRLASDSSGEWQSERMIYGGLGDWLESLYCFNFPTADHYQFYISNANADSRTPAFVYKRYGTMELDAYAAPDENGYDHTTVRTLSNAVFFTDNAGFSDPVICYCPSGSTAMPSAWKSAPMTPDGQSDCGEYVVDRYRFDLPRDVFCFYITDGERRTENIWFAGTMDVMVTEFNESKDWYEVQGEAVNIMMNWELSDTNIGGAANELYYDRFKQYLNSIPGFVRMNSGISYRELYCHQNALGETDWVLLYAVCSVPDERLAFGTVGTRAFYIAPRTPFRFGLGLYDVAEDAFYDLADMQDYSRYDGLLQAIDEAGKGRMIGDIDRDYQLTIVDATVMQRCLAGIVDFPEEDIAVIDGFSPMYYHETAPDAIHEVDDPIVYYSDFDRDGVREITDVTMLQRHLAGIC